MSPSSPAVGGVYNLVLGPGEGTVPCSCHIRGLEEDSSHRQEGPRSTVAPRRPALQGPSWPSSAPRDESPVPTHQAQTGDRAARPEGSLSRSEAPQLLSPGPSQARRSPGFCPVLTKAPVATRDKSEASPSLGPLQLSGEGGPVSSLRAPGLAWGFPGVGPAWGQEAASCS